MRTRSSGFRPTGGAEGAVLVHVAVAIIGLLAFCALVVDYGTMWVSRRQAQNAADAAALAGAISLAFDSGTDSTAPAWWRRKSASRQGVRRDADHHAGWGQAADPTDDISFMVPDLHESMSAWIRDIWRHMYSCERLSKRSTGHPLPVFFAPLFGRRSKACRPTATAVIAGGNATNCLQALWPASTSGIESGPGRRMAASMKPRPDTPIGKGSDHREPDFYIPQPSNGQLPGNARFSGADYEADTYAPPSPTSSGTSYRGDSRRTAGRSAAITASWMKMTTVPRQHRAVHSFNPSASLCQWHGNCYASNRGSDGQTRIIGGNVDTETGYLERADRPVAEHLVAKDPTAQWYRAQHGIRQWAPDVPVTRGASTVRPRAMNSSPRIVPCRCWTSDTFMQNPTGSNKHAPFRT